MKLSAAVVLTFGVAACGDNLEIPGTTTPPAFAVVADGVCPPLPFTFVANDRGLFWIASCDHSIRTLSTLDGAITVLAANEPTASMLAVDDRAVYWMRSPAEGTGELVARPHLGGAPIVLASAQDQMFPSLPEQLIAHDGIVYRSEFADVLAVPGDGSGPQVRVASGNAGPFLAADDTVLYWDDIADLHRQRLGTTDDETLVTGTNTQIDPIVLTDAGVYFWRDGLERVDKATGAVTTAQPSTAPDSRMVTSDAGSVFWFDGGQLFQLTDAGARSVLAPLPGTLDGLAVAGDAVYWAGDGMIYRAPTVTP